MTSILERIPNYDYKDIGWRRVYRQDQMHYYRSSRSSDLAISHCKQVRRKSDLIEYLELPKCEYCSLVEEVRASLYSKLDGKGQ